MPLTGITITSQRLANNPVGGNAMIQTMTDAQGRYRLLGMPKGNGNAIRAVPGSDQPYLVAHRDVPDSPGLDPVTADFEIKRGIWIEGRLTDKVTGKPVVGEMSYHAHPDNPNNKVYGYVADATPTTAHEDGSYRVAGMPGPGMVVVRFVNGYLRAHERDDEFGIKEVFLPTIPLPTMNYTAIARIDPAQKEESVQRDLTLDPGWTFTGTVLGPDRQPLTGAWGIGLTSRGNVSRGELEVMKTAEFTVSGFNPYQPRPLFFQHPQKGLVGVAQPPKNRGDSITVQLQPGATVEGRLVDADGRARAGVELVIYRHHKELAQPGDFVYFPQRHKTDQQGRFRIEGLLPGYEFAMYDGKGYRPLGEALRTGQTKDLGDMTIGND
jgi:hypothetical protein